MIVRRTNFTDEHILGLLPKERKVTIRHSKPVEIVGQGNIPAQAVLNSIDTVM